MELFNLFSPSNWEHSVLIILNLILLESLLSVDNAAALATMVMDLEPVDRKKALKYGIFGAYFFRGICLLLAEYLIHIWWLEPLGGLYLLYLAYKFFLSKHKSRYEEAEEKTPSKESNIIYKISKKYISPFWSTVIVVEFMDLAFSMDNVFAAVAFSSNITLIIIGVFIGILAMRFVASAFVKLMEKYPALETSSFIVIAILGLKLTLSVLCHFKMSADFCYYYKHEMTDVSLSIMTVIVFITPVLYGLTKREKINN